MANIIEVVPPQYVPPITSGQNPVGGITDQGTGNLQAQTTDTTQTAQLDAIITLLRAGHSV